MEWGSFKVTESFKGKDGIYHMLGCRTGQTYSFHPRWSTRELPSDSLGCGSRSALRSALGSGGRWRCVCGGTGSSTAGTGALIWSHWQFPGSPHLCCYSTCDLKYTEEEPKLWERSRGGAGAPGQQFLEGGCTITLTAEASLMGHRAGLAVTFLGGFTAYASGRKPVLHKYFWYWTQKRIRTGTGPGGTGVIS